MTNESETGLLERLGRLGLTENDAKAYMYLLEKGQPSAGSKIAARLNLHRQYVHNSLRKLLAFDLIEEVPIGARMLYKALPPRYLTNLAKRQLENAESAARELDKLSAVGAEQDFEAYRGTRQVIDFEERLVHSLKNDEIQYIIGGGAEIFINFFGERYEEISSVAAERNLRTQYVGSEGDRVWLKRAKAVFDNFEFRLLPALPEAIVQTVVRFDTVTLYTFGSPPMVYFIKSPTVAADYKKFFDMLWNMATPVDL